MEKAETGAGTDRQIVHEEPRLVLVEWQDAYCSAGWRPLEDLECEPLLCRSVGWLVDEDEDVIMIAPHITTEHSDAPIQVNGTMSIPRKWAVKIVDFADPAISSPSCHPSRPRLSSPPPLQGQLRQHS